MVRFLCLDFETWNIKDLASAFEIGWHLLDSKAGVIDRDVQLLRPPRDNAMTVYWERRVRFADVLDKPNFQTYWHQRFAAVFKSADVIASHTGYDRRILHGLCDEYGLALPRSRWLNTLMVARTFLDIKRAGLAVVARCLDVDFKHHQAGDDSFVLVALLQRVLEDGQASLLDELSQEHPGRNLPTVDIASVDREVPLPEDVEAPLPNGGESSHLVKMLMEAFRNDTLEEMIQSLPEPSVEHEEQLRHMLLAAVAQTYQNDLGTLVELLQDRHVKSALEHFDLEVDPSLRRQALLSLASGDAWVPPNVNRDTTRRQQLLAAALGALLRISLVELVGMLPAPPQRHYQMKRADLQAHLEMHWVDDIEPIPQRLSPADINAVCDTLDVSRAGYKRDKVRRLIEWSEQ